MNSLNIEIRSIGFNKNTSLIKIALNNQRPIPCHMSRVTKNMSLVFSTRSDTNRTVQLQKIAGGLKFRNLEVEVLTFSMYVAKAKALISCAFVFANAEISFSHDATHMIMT